MEELKKVIVFNKKKPAKGGNIRDQNGVRIVYSRTNYDIMDSDLVIMSLDFGDWYKIFGELKDITELRHPTKFHRYSDVAKKRTLIATLPVDGYIDRENMKRKNFTYARLEHMINSGEEIPLEYQFQNPFSLNPTPTQNLINLSKPYFDRIYIERENERVESLVNRVLKDILIN